MFSNLVAIPRKFYTPDEKRLSPLAYLFLLVLCFGFFTPGMVTMPPTDRDESSFAQASKQMIENGNYADIRLQTEPRYKKPIGIYWLQSLSVRLLSPNHLDEIWAYRVPSFLGATIAVLMTAALGCLLFSPMIGLLAAMMLAGCVLLNVEARLATTDAMLLACIMSAQYALARAYLKQASGWAMPLLFWTAVAAGILIKGPLILLPLAATLLWLRICDKNLAWFDALRPVYGLIFAMVLTLPWFVMISMQSHGAFLEQSAGQDMLAKLWQGQNRGIMPPGMHLMALPIAFFPFVLFFVFAAPDIWKNRRDDAIKFCLGWAIPTWIVFELSFTKLPHYVLPVYPALALLAAKYLCEGFPTIASTTRRLPIVLVVGFWLMLGTGFAATFVWLPEFVDHNWSSVQIAAGIALVLSQGAALLMLPRDKVASMVALTIGGLIFMTATFGTTLPNIHRLWLSREIVDAIAEEPTPCPHIQIISTGYSEPSLVFLGGTDTLFLNDGGQAAQALMENKCRIVAIDGEHQQAFLDSFAKVSLKPMEFSFVDGLNSGHGATAGMALYRLPLNKKP